MYDVVFQAQRTVPAKVAAIQPAINSQGCAPPSRAARQVSQLFGAAILPHQPDTARGLDRPDQDAGADAWHFARDVEHERGPGSEIDIGVSALEEKRPVARGHAAPGVPGGVADVIRLGLDDTAAHDASGQHAPEHLADQKTREPDGIDGQLRPIEHAKACFSHGLCPSAGKLTVSRSFERKGKWGPEATRIIPFDAGDGNFPVPRRARRNWIRKAMSIARSPGRHSVSARERTFRSAGRASAANAGRHRD